MSRQLDNLYKIQKKDIPKAGAILLDAFQYDPLWKKVFEDIIEIDNKCAFFESPVRYCRKYGEAYATSEHLEGIAAWVPGDYAEMTTWRVARSGAIGSGIKAGRKYMMQMAKFAQKTKDIFWPMEEDRKANMKEKAYIYLMIIGVDPELQGQGFGGKLLKALVEESEQTNTPLYLEATTEKSMGIYEKLGFKLLDQIILPIINIPLWGMVREP